MEVDIITLKNQLLDFHTKLRRNPRSVIPVFEERQSYYKDKLYFVRDKPKKAIRTREGFAPVRELIDQLRRTEPFDDLTYSPELQMAAQDHAQYLSRQNEIAQTSNDLQQRVERYTDWEGHLFQSVEYGFIQPEELLINLLIDDGLRNRPNRMNILNPEIKFFGLGIARHSEYNVIAVFIYATQLRKKREEVDAVQVGRRRIQSVTINDNDGIQRAQVVEEGENPNRVWCGDRANGDRCLLF